VNLYERYLAKDTRELVFVLESPQNYQAEAVKIAREILYDRNEPYEKLIAMAEHYHIE